MQTCQTCQQPIPLAAQRLQSSLLLDEHPLWEMRHGDSLPGLERLADASVHAVITDPPYSEGLNNAQRTQSSKSKYVSGGASYQSTLPDIAGDSVMREHWFSNFERFLAQAQRVLVPGGGLLCFMGWRNLSVAQTLLAASGLHPRGLIVWDKGGGRPYKGGFRMQSEFILWASRGALRAWAGQPYLPGVFRHATLVNGKVHITQKPEALMAELIQTVPPGGLIVDPFAGSGTTGVAAIKAGRRFIGWELVDQYYDTAVQRLRDAEK